MATHTFKRTAAYAGLATAAAKNKFLNATDHSSQAAIANRMGSMHGLPQKIGQMLSFRSADSEDDNPFAQLQDQGAALPLSWVQNELAKQWETDPTNLLDHIDPTPYAASICQVHRAVTLDGREVALKIKYPDIDRSIRQDLSMLNLLSVPFGGFSRGFDLAEYQETLKQGLVKELDLSAEAITLQSLGNATKALSTVHIPRVLSELSTPDVLVTEWCHGSRWQEIQNQLNDTQRRKLGNTLLDFHLHSLFRLGICQSDWHPGNLRFQPETDNVHVSLFDFGCVFRPTSTEQLALARLIRATIHQTEAPLPLFAALGFSAPLLTPLAHKIPALARVLFEPFCVDHAYNLSDWNLSERLEDILGDDRWNFRIAAPARLIYLMRSWQGITFYLAKLGQGIRWKPAFQKAIQHLEKEIDAFEPPEIDDAVDFKAMSKHLKIRVSEQAKTKVQITQQLGALERLSSLLDDDLKERIRRNGIDLTDVVRQARKSAYQPGNLLSVEHDGKQVDVWLE